MRRVLGKGLSQLLGEQEPVSGASTISLSKIVANERQPRKQFDEDALRELAESIRQVGMMQPIVVRPIDAERYEIIAGERRYRAAKMAGLLEVPIVIRNADSREVLQLALIENIQRENITALECADAYQSLASDFGLTQEEIAERVGKSRSAVANILRLLKLHPSIRSGLEQNKITEGHARALLMFDTEAEQLQAYGLVLQRNLTVREVERLAAGKQKPRPRRPDKPSPEPEDFQRLEDAISEKLGTRCKISRVGKGGKIEIEFFTEDDLARIADVLDIRL